MKEDAQMQEPLVGVIAAMLDETVQRNERNRKTCTLASFNGSRPPLTPTQFVTRVAKYSGASPCCFAVALIYLERLKKRDPGVCLTSANFQRLFIVAVMSASKFLDDFYYSNKHWAEVGGIQTVELNRLELEFLFRMSFSLHMRREEYDWYAEELHQRVGPQHIAAAQAAAVQVPVASEAHGPRGSLGGAAGSGNDSGAGSTHADPPHRAAAESRGDVELLSASTTPNSSAAPALLPAAVPITVRGSDAVSRGVRALPPSRHAESALPPGVNQKMDWVYC